VDRTFSTNGGGEDRVDVLVGKPEGKRPLGRPRRMWLDIIIMDLVEIGFVLFRIGTSGGLLWMRYETSDSIKCCETIEWLHNWWPLQ
jgi:hypothetical protein